MSNILGPITIEALDPPVEAQSTGWQKLSEEDMQSFAEYTGAIDKGGKWGHRLNIFFEDGRSRYAIFSEQEWDFLNTVAPGRASMKASHGKIFSKEEIADIKKMIHDASSPSQSAT
jgi:hypothetical protein